MGFVDGEVVNISEGRFPKRYALSLKDAKLGAIVPNLRKSCLKEAAIAHGVFYKENLYGPLAMEMLAEKTPIKVVSGTKRVTLKGNLSLLENMMPIALDVQYYKEGERIRFLPDELK
jgi:hypothetical protein